MKTETTEAPVSGAVIEIAVLDDDLDFRNYLEDFLKDEGAYSVRTFGHPDDFFEAAEHRLPDIVRLDMKMGESRGDKVLEQILQRWPGMCVIIITGYPSLEDLTWFAFFVPARTPSPIVNKLNAAIQTAMRSDEVTSGMTKLAVEPDAIAMSDFARLIASESDRWKAIVQAIGFVPTD